MDRCNVMIPHNYITFLNYINSDGKFYFMLSYVFEYHKVSEAGHREVRNSQLFTFTSSTAMEWMKRMFLHATEAVRETINAEC